MSSSDESSKIDLLDSPAQLKKKLKMAFCEPGNITDNGVLSWIKHVLFSVQSTPDFLVERKEEFGGDKRYTNYEDIEKDFQSEALHPGDLKNGVLRELDKLLSPIRKEFEAPELTKLVSNAYPVEKKKAPPSGSKKSATSTGKGEAGDVKADNGDMITPNRLDIRVGRITEIKRHPDADSLFVETVDLGEDKPRTVVSGLVGLVPEEELQGRLGVFLCNLKPQKMRGIESQAMLLCASKDVPREVEPLSAPEGSEVGDRVTFDGADPCTPDDKLNPKKKIWEKLQTDLNVNKLCEAFWQSCSMKTDKGPITSSNVKDAPIK